MKTFRVTNEARDSRPHGYDPKTSPVVYDGPDHADADAHFHELKHAAIITYLNGNVAEIRHHGLDPDQVHQVEQAYGNQDR